MKLARSVCIIGSRYTIREDYHAWMPNVSESSSIMQRILAEVLNYHVIDNYILYLLKKKNRNI